MTWHTSAELKFPARDGSQHLAVDSAVDFILLDLVNSLVAHSHRLISLSNAQTRYSGSGAMSSMNDAVAIFVDRAKFYASDAFLTLTQCICKPDATLKINGRSYRIEKLLGEGGKLSCVCILFPFL
jgi:hypothetical protein